jgi:hypothetical protein
MSVAITPRGSKALAASSGQAVAPWIATHERRFRLICVVVPLLAIAALHAQLPGALWPHLSLVADYATLVIGLTAIAFLSYLALVKVCSKRLRRVSFGRCLSRWHPVYIRTFPRGDTTYALAALAVTLPTFQLYKSAVVGRDGFHLDALFTRMDQWLFNGHDPWKLTHAMFPGDSLTWVIDRINHPLFLPMIALFILFAITRERPELRRTYMATYLVSWLVIGMGLAQALASAGPVFDGILWGDGTTFAPLLDRLDAQAQGAGGLYAVAARDYLMSASLTGEAGIGTGISAMPSMHVALAMMWTMVGWAISRGLGAALTLYTLIIWIGSVHLGWHYAVDGLLAAVMVAAIWYLCGRVLGLYGTASRPSAVADQASIPPASFPAGRREGSNRARDCASGR